MVQFTYNRQNLVDIGTDKPGPAPRTRSMVEYPVSMPQQPPDEFNWSGFRTVEHRQMPEYNLEGYASLGDWLKPGSTRMSRAGCPA